MYQSPNTDRQKMIPELVKSITANPSQSVPSPIPCARTLNDSHWPGIPGQEIALKNIIQSIDTKARILRARPDHVSKCISMTQLQAMLNLTAHEMETLARANKRFPMKIPQYYAQLMDTHAVLQQVIVPSARELIRYKDDSTCDVHADESRYQPVEGIVHRYPGKLLFLPTLKCFGHCRFCFRSGQRIKAMDRKKTDAAINYIRKRTDVREVLVTGGDPLTLPMERLEEILARIHAIRHVEIIRIGTRALAYAPQVITREMVAMLARYKPVFMSLSFVHPAEVTPYCEEKLNQLADSGIVMLQQGPILKGVNDNALVLKQMYEKLARNRVLAYYAIYGIYAPGVRHFIVNKKIAKQLSMALENSTSGHCLPHMITLDQNDNKTRSVA
ncbi:MAG: radical SAM protein [Pseudomonadota bacterium]